jgi:hypothetical protein
MTVVVRVHAIGAALVFSCLLTLGAVIGGVAWLVPAGDVRDALMAISQFAIGLSVAWPVMTVLAAWVATQPRYLTCSACHNSVPETTLQVLSDKRLVCSSCVAPASLREVA